MKKLCHMPALYVGMYFVRLAECTAFMFGPCNGEAVSFLWSMIWILCYLNDSHNPTGYNVPFGYRIFSIYPSDPITSRVAMKSYCGRTQTHNNRPWRMTHRNRQRIMLPEPQVSVPSFTGPSTGMCTTTVYCCKKKRRTPVGVVAS